jgi:hypothetical protein
LIEEKNEKKDKGNMRAVKSKRGKGNYAPGVCSWNSELEDGIETKTGGTKTTR